VHLAGPLKAREERRLSRGGPPTQRDADEGSGYAPADFTPSHLLADLARRYSQDYDPQSATYDFIELALAAGLQAGTTLQYTIKQIHPKYYIGSGQFASIAEQLQGEQVDLVAVSAPLSPVHQRNWEAELNLPVLNRQDIIFAIFEQNARTAEGKLQVELAHLRYELPRIVRSYEQLDPLAGGIGTLGPGEQLTERIKRRHRERIHHIEEQLTKLRGQRALRRQQRSKSGIFIASIVGYTNVGKSTLLNRLTGSGVLVADQYFATLDPTARALVLPTPMEQAPVLQAPVFGDNEDVQAEPPAPLDNADTTGGPPALTRLLLTDTVGFLDELPDELVTSFRATLEEMEGASLLIHLADASHARVTYQIEAVRKVINPIGLSATPELLVFNKCDRVDPDTRAELAAHHPGALFISAKTGEGVSELLAELARRVAARAPA
jgi:GTPase